MQRFFQLFCWCDSKLIAEIFQSTGYVVLMKYTLMKFWTCFVVQNFYFFINFINDFSLPFHVYRVLYAIFAVPWINGIIELFFNYSKFSFFPWNVISLFIFRILNKYISLFDISISTSRVTICRWYCR